jgi:hypothetical protein
MRVVRKALAATITIVALAGIAAGNAAAACPNEAFRTGVGSHLPECRAYEQVSPIDKNDGDVTYGPQGLSAQPLTASPIAPSGDRVSFNSFNSFAGNPSAQLLNQYLATRGPEGWSTVGISPPRTAPYSGPPVDTRSTYVGFTEDLTRMAVVGWWEPGQFTLMRRETDGTFDLVDAPKAPAEGLPVPATQPLFGGASADFSRIVYQGAEGALGGVALYLWSEGVSIPISIPPGETIPVAADPGEEINAFGPGWGRLMSDDGSRVYWKPRSGDRIFLYENGGSREITLSQCDTGKVGEPGPGGNCVPEGESAAGPFLPGAIFQTASRDGSLALFTSGAELTNDSGPSSNLYRYDADSDILTDLTPYSADPNGAGVMGVVAATDDLSHVYFAANGVLAPGGTAPSTPCVSSGTGARTCNLYLWHDGEFTFVAGISQADLPAWDSRRKPKEHSALAQISPDGRHLLFTSTTPTSQVIPGSTYDNAGHREVYLFDADTGEVRCVSCNPNGGPSTHTTELGQQQGGMPNPFALYANMTADAGRVFFETAASLLARDTNGVRDVYEWRAQGTGDCASAAQNGGCLNLISTGRAAGPSFFQNTTPSGDDVLFSTRQQLVGQDVDQLVDLYDARVGGGLAGQYPPAPPAPCLGETCRSAPPGAPPMPQIGSSSFAGPGDLTPERRPAKKKARCKGKKAANKARGKAKKKGKCARRSPASAKRQSTGKRG